MKMKLVLFFGLLFFGITGSLLYFSSQKNKTPADISDTSSPPKEKQALSPHEILSAQTKAASLSPDTITDAPFLTALQAGLGITIDGGRIPTITNSGVVSLQNQTGALSFTPGNGMNISGLTIENTDGGSLQSIFKTITIDNNQFSASNNNDTFSLLSGAGIQLTTDSNNKKITIGQNFLQNLTTYGLLYAVNPSSVQTVAPGQTGYVLQSNAGGAPSWISPQSFATNALSFEAITAGTNANALRIGNTGSLTYANGMIVTGGINANALEGVSWDSPATIGSGTPNSARFTTLNATAAVQFSTLGAGIVHSNSTGSLSSSAVNLASTEVTNALTIANGGTGLSSFTQGDLPYYASGSTMSALPIGANTTVLTSNGTAPVWSNTLSLTGGITANGTIRSNSLFWLSNGSTGTSTVLRLENFSNNAAATGMGLAAKLSGTDNVGTEWQFMQFVKEQTWTGTATTRDAALTFGTLEDNVRREAIRIAANGNVGINTTTPQEKLHITNGNVRIGNGSLCVHATDTACSGTTSGTIYANNTTVQAADVAENYISAQQLEPGDVVMPEGGENEQAVKKTANAYEAQTIGIVSTSPGVTLNSDARTDQTYPYLHPIALAGRVPVNVSTENGAIAVGDLLTTSALPGVAMKATTRGAIIGKALQKYSGTGTGKIMVFVTLSTPVTEQTSLAQEFTPSTDTWQTRMASLSAQFLKLPDLTDILRRLTNLENQFAASPSAQKLQDIVGEDVLKKGETMTEITASEMTAKAKVFVTAETIIDVPLVVTEKKDKSFTVRMSKPAPEDIHFDWWIKP